MIKKYYSTSYEAKYGGNKSFYLNDLNSWSLCKAINFGIFETINEKINEFVRNCPKEQLRYPKQSVFKFPPFCEKCCYKDKYCPNRKCYWSSHTDFSFYSDDWTILNF